MLTFEGAAFRQGDFDLSADLSVGAQGVVAVIGPSGAGKSTLLSAVAGFLSAERGRVLWDGVDLGPLGPAARPVSMVFQDHNLFPHLTVFQNVALGVSPKMRLSAAESGALRDVLARVGLEGMDDRRPGALSGGQQSRVALARALLRDKPIVCLDEPFAALGPALRHEMLDLVGETFAERLVLMVTHDPSDAARVAERIIVVMNGAATGPFQTREVLADPPEGLRAYLGTGWQTRDL